MSWGSLATRTRPPSFPAKAGIQGGGAARGIPFTTSPSTGSYPKVSTSEKVRMLSELPGGPARKQSTFLHFFRFRSPRKKTEDNQPNYDDQMSLPPDGAMQASGAPGPAAVDRAAGLCRGSGVGDAAVRCY